MLCRDSRHLKWVRTVFLKIDEWSVEDGGYTKLDGSRVPRMSENVVPMT